jgi:hypothetical protein
VRLQVRRNSNRTYRQASLKRQAKPPAKRPQAHLLETFNIISALDLSRIISSTATRLRLFSYIPLHTNSYSNNRNKTFPSSCVRAPVRPTISFREAPFEQTESQSGARPPQTSKEPKCHEYTDFQINQPLRYHR